MILASVRVLFLVVRFISVVICIVCDVCCSCPCVFLVVLLLRSFVLFSLSLLVLLLGRAFVKTWFTLNLSYFLFGIACCLFVGLFVCLFVDLFTCLHAFVLFAAVSLHHFLFCFVCLVAGLSVCVFVLLLLSRHIVGWCSTERTYNNKLPPQRSFQAKRFHLNLGFAARKLDFHIAIVTQRG